MVGAEVPANGALSCRLALCYLIKLLEYLCPLMLAGQKWFLKTTDYNCEMLLLVLIKKALVQGGIETSVHQAGHEMFGRHSSDV